jgi:hypothetical protein
VAISAITILLLSAFTGLALEKKDDARTTIQEGVLTYSAGHYLNGVSLMTGFDPYGYNYQGHRFNGYYCNVYLGRDGFPPYDGDDEAYLAENPLLS